MPRMPEIVGESQDSGPELAENEVLETEREVDTFTNPISEEIKQPGAFESPLQLRLNDFSGEGERAPPI
ncbi:MAG: hypothetical protein JSV03_00700 [Planctomycetota bacterium]|nr:MAG: hypothetical protein JSV03_00700 [Planctomycetota bacterium]